MNRNIIPAVLALVLLALAGCGGKRTRTAAPKQESVSTERPAPAVTPRRLPVKEQPAAQLPKKEPTPTPPETIIKTVGGVEYTAVVRSKGHAAGEAKEPPAVNVMADIAAASGKRWSVHYTRTGSAMKMNVMQDGHVMVVRCDGNMWSVSKGRCMIVSDQAGMRVTLNGLPTETKEDAEAAQTILAGAQDLMNVVYSLLDGKDGGSVREEFETFKDLLPAKEMPKTQEEPMRPAEVVQLEETHPPAERAANNPPIIEVTEPEETVMPLEETRETAVIETAPAAEPMREEEAPAAVSDVQPPKEVSSPAEPAPTPSVQETKQADMAPAAETTAASQPSTPSGSEQAVPAEEDGRSPWSVALILLGIAGVMWVGYIAYRRWPYLQEHLAPARGTQMEQHVKHINEKMREQKKAIVLPAQQDSTGHPAD